MRNRAVRIDPHPRCGGDGLDVATTALQREIDELAATLRAGFAAGMAELRTELKGDIAELKDDIVGLGREMGGLRSDMGALEVRVEAMFTRMLLQLIGAIAGLFTVFFVLSRII